MEPKYFSAYFFILFMLLAINCRVNKNPLESTWEQGDNLIQNSSFEKNGKPSLQFWYVRDSSKLQFSRDTPSHGGKWSVFLHAQHWGPMPESPAYFITTQFLAERPG